MEFWIKAAQFLTSLSILVILHELGHFIPAKLFKTRVEKFYLFFNPWFSVFKFKKGETEYGLGWLPLGGFVKISGMIDESMDTEQMKQPAQPWEFRSKPAWQRLVIMLGGVTVNLILGFIIFAMVLFVWGKDTLEADKATWGVTCDSFMVDHGMRDGDKITKVNGVPAESIQQVRVDLLLDDVKEITVLRNGTLLDLPLPENFGQLMVDSGVKVPFAVRVPTVIDKLIPEFPAETAGFLIGDSIVSVNNKPLRFYNEVSDEIRSHPNEEITIELYREGQLISKRVNTNEDGQIGFYPVAEYSRFFEIKHEEFSLLEAIPAGYYHAKEQVVQYVISMKFLFSASGAKQIGGFASIGNLFASEWDWRVFWARTAWLSLVLAVMNVLPIPALDGGHVAFLLYEMVAGKAPGQKFLERAQMVGIVLLLSLLVFANGNDIYRAFFG